MRPPLTYYGGKQLMAKEIVTLLPDHKIYCEPFFGGGAVFFEKHPSYLEVINDTNDRLITFYQVLQENPEELFNAINNTPHSESLSKLAREIYNRRIEHDDLGMAWAVWQMTNGNFTGSPHGGWKWDNGASGSHTARVLAKKRTELTDVYYRRIQNVQISCRDALRVISDRDSIDTVFYLDPPYPGANQKHYSGYSFQDFFALLDLLKTIKGKFILSNYWSQMLKYFIATNAWHFISKDVNIRIMNLNVNTYDNSRTEILLMNFKPPVMIATEQKLKFA